MQTLTAEDNIQARFANALTSAFIAGIQGQSVVPQSAYQYTTVHEDKHFSVPNAFGRYEVAPTQDVRYTNSAVVELRRTFTEGVYEVRLMMSCHNERGTAVIDLPKLISSETLVEVANITARQIVLFLSQFHGNPYEKVTEALTRLLARLDGEHCMLALKPGAHSGASLKAGEEEMQALENGTPDSEVINLRLPVTVMDFMREESLKTDIPVHDIAAKLLMNMRVCDFVDAINAMRKTGA